MPGEIENIDALFERFRKMSDRIGEFKDVSVVVGYTANYALYVHENMAIWPPGMRLAGQPRSRGRGAYWDPQGRARPKFLEEPLRTHRDVLAQIVIDMLARGKSLTQALLAAGLRLQRESQMLVPVDTGNLKNSAFTRVERGSAETAEV
jgi:hypothetical protein